MRPVILTERVALLCGDSKALDLGEGSIDAVVCDPPYELGFMGKKWDATGIAYDVELWRAVYRALKPGAHLLAFGGSRTYHRMACAIEDAGFEVRDSLHWCYGSGFPKSLNVHKSSLERVEARYAKSTCVCLDAGSGSAARHDVGRRGSESDRALGEHSTQATAASGDPNLPIDARGSSGVLRELLEARCAEDTRPETIAEALLQHSVCGGGAETSRLGVAPVRGGVEGSTGGGEGTRQVVPSLPTDADHGAARPSSEAVPVRGDEPAGEPGRALRCVSPHDRGDHHTHAGSDPDRRHARIVHADDQDGRRGPVARVCSWCALPDRGWLDSLTPLGTALKPAHEPIILARKPLSGTVAANVLANGTGALNVDGCRIGSAGGTTSAADAAPNFKNEVFGRGMGGLKVDPDARLGRWPANFLLSHLAECEAIGECEEARNIIGNVEAGAYDREGTVLDAGLHQRRSVVTTTTTTTDYRCAPGCPVAELDGQSGISKSTPRTPSSQHHTGGVTNFARGSETSAHADTGGASRFFYCAKPSTRERDYGCEGLPKKSRAEATDREEGSAGSQHARAGAGSKMGRANTHPTVKPIELMRWLCRLITPPGGTVLDPFTGSGTTGIAAIREGFSFVGVEQSDEYIEIAKARITKALEES